MSSGVLLTNTAFAALQAKQVTSSLKSLTNLTPHQCQVIRAGKTLVLPSSQLMPGDIILVNEEDQIPADAKLLGSQNLLVEEASLTGEAIPVVKKSKGKGRQSWLFMGTKVVAGHGRAVVIHTGSFTEMGKIRENLDLTKFSGSSPIYRQLDQVGQTLVTCGVGVSILTMLTGLVRKKEPGETIVNATSLAVLVIPDGLLPLITMTLALSAVKLEKRVFWSVSCLQLIP